MRGRRWIRWGIATAFFGFLALIVWLVRRRRTPIVRERPAPKTIALIYGAAFCFVLLLTTSGVVLRTFGYQVARVEGSAMASTILDQDRLIVEGWRYFVMGDHRNNSSDSRHWGFVPAKYIVGQVRVRWFPLSAVRTFQDQRDVATGRTKTPGR